MSRLFCSGEGDERKFALAASIADAQTQLGDRARIPTGPDIQLFWSRERLDGLRCQEVADRFGVTKQTASNWRRKAFGDEERRQEMERRLRLIQESLLKGSTAAEAAEVAGANRSTVYSVARKLSLAVAKHPPHHKRPSDEEIVALAQGRTWRELAAACNLRLASLRSYLYARPELSERVRQVLVQGKSRVLLDDEVVRRLWNEGMSAYRISEQLGCSQMAVYARLHQLGLREAPYAMRRGKHEPA